MNEDINELLKEKASQLKEHGFDLIPKPNEEIRGYGITKFKPRGLSEGIKKNINEGLKYQGKGVIRIKASDLQRQSCLLRRMTYKKSLLKKVLNLARDCGSDLHIEF